MGPMKRLTIVLLAIGLVLAGCSGPEIKKKDYSGIAEPDGAGAASDKGSTTTTTGGTSTGGGGIQPLTGGAGAAGVTPVVGGETMSDGGGGVTDAAKSKAKGVKTRIRGDDHSQDDAPSDGY
jgi:hypothetical protein